MSTVNLELTAMCERTGRELGEFHVGAFALRITTIASFTAAVFGHFFIIIFGNPTKETSCVPLSLVFLPSLVSKAELVGFTSLLVGYIMEATDRDDGHSFPCFGFCCTVVGRERSRCSSGFCCREGGSEGEIYRHLPLLIVE